MLWQKSRYGQYTVGAYDYNDYISMSIFDPKVDFLNLMYEASSAIGTVGLSADLTPHLSRASHIVLMILMYIGRIGPLTMALVFAGRANKSDRFRELPEKKIMLG